MTILFYMIIATATVLLALGVKNEYISSGTNCRAVFLNKTYLSAIFFILFICSAIRFDIGNDYENYTLTAHEAYVGGYVVTEVGFNSLVRLVYNLLGGEYYEAICAIFAFVTILIFLKTMYEDSVDFTFAFFIFMAFGMYFQTYNTVRYYLALSIVLYSVKFVLSRDIIRFVFWILVAALFHKSVLIVIPIYLMAYYRWRLWQIITGIVISACCFVGKSVMLKLALVLYPSYKDTIYLNGGTSLPSIIRGCVVLLFYIWFIKKYPEAIPERKTELRMYAQLNALSLIVYTAFSFLPVITRIGYYLSVSQIFMIPLLVEGIPDLKVKKKVKLLVILICMINFIYFLLTADRDGVGLMPYRSWIFETERFVY